MAKPRNRHDISLRGSTFDKIKSHCAETGQRVNDFVDALIEEKLDDLERVAEPARRNGSSPNPADGSGYATF